VNQLLMFVTETQGGVWAQGTSWGDGPPSWVHLPAPHWCYRSSPWGCHGLHFWWQYGVFFVSPTNIQSRRNVLRMLS